MTFLEEHAAFSRMGADGIAQVNTSGLIAAAFDHRDSRAGDPNLHTHVAVSNKVQRHRRPTAYRAGWPWTAPRYTRPPSPPRSCTTPAARPV